MFFHTLWHNQHNMTKKLSLVWKKNKAFPFATLVYQRVEGLKEMVHPPSQDSQDLHAVSWIPWFGWVVCLKSCGKFHRPPKAGSRFATARITWTIHFLPRAWDGRRDVSGSSGRCSQLTRTGHDMKGKTIHQLNRGWWLIRSYFCWLWYG